ncbi:MAG: hypothetical protein ACK46A_02145 [Akkermansiaceae bacterium]|jgi:hypothetical protein|nr:hypothetical protein [Luteolibacter sp.]
MPQNLTVSVAWHDDATSALHAKHKAEKALRLQNHYEAVPAIEREAGGGIVDGVFKSPIKGFSFKLSGGSAHKVSDSAAYTRQALAMSKSRAQFVRVRIRDGSVRREAGRYKYGAVSLVTTLPPWCVKTVSRIGSSEREHLLLFLAEAQAREIKKVSERDLFGGGAHFNNAVPHFHLHVPKTSAEGSLHPKSKFLTAGPWIVGAHRIETKFPGLLTEKKRSQLARHLERKDQSHLIDVRCAAAIDRELEVWIRERGLWSDYQAECTEYFRRKSKAQSEEPLRQLIQAAVGHHARSGVWPIAYSAMSFAAWRMIPRELRVPIMICIRVHQVIRNPSKVFKIGARMLAEMDRQPEMKGPSRS